MAITPATSKAKLTVTEGLRKGKTYALQEGVNYIGRKGPTEINIDLTEQENPGVAVQVNRFALVWFDNTGLSIADTGTRIGTVVNGTKIPSKKKFPLNEADTLKFGKTVLKVQVVKKQKTGVQK